MGISLKADYKNLNNNLSYAITGWLTRSKNSFFLGPNINFENEWRFLSNNLPLNNLEVKHFHRFKINICGSASKIHISGKKAKSDLLNELNDLKATHDLDYFKEHFSPESSISRNSALYILLKQNLQSAKTKLLNSFNYNDFTNLCLPLNEADIEVINDLKSYVIGDKEVNLDLIFVPATFQSIFDDRNFFYEIKHHKFLYNNFDENKILNGHSKTTMERFFSELQYVDSSLNFDHEVSYFDIFTLLKDPHQSQFLDFIFLLYKRFPEDQEIEFHQFLIQLFHIINNYYFRLITAQQEFVFNQIYLYHSKDRSMTLLDTVLNMIQRIQDADKEQLYFFDTLCDLNIVNKFKNILEQYNVDKIDEEFVYQILYFSADNPRELDALCDIAYLLKRLHSKTPLIEFAKFALYHIRQHCEKNNIKFTRKINKFFEGYLNDLFDIQPSARKTRKYLNEFYYQDLNNYLNKDRVFVSKILDIFDVLRFEKLKGKLPDNIFSNVLKKR